MANPDKRGPETAACPFRYGVVIPARNAGAFVGQQMAAVRAQTAAPSEVVVIDSSSTDGTADRYRAAGCKVVSIEASSFDHGRTRNAGMAELGQAEFTVFLTQDAIPASPLAFERLLGHFADPAVGLVCGRQLPRGGADALERHARLYNYPAASNVRDLAEARRIGVKAVFNSNSFAAYRRVALASVGGFPERVIMGEDQIAAGKMLLAGWKIAYAGDAAVVHSHAYSALEQFRRYFDTGVYRADHRFLEAEFGAAGSEGLRFIRSELRYLLANDPRLLPRSALSMAAKLAGYRLGHAHASLPPALKRRFAMHKHHFGRPAGAPLAQRFAPASSEGRSP